ncbi:hypothetical protein ND856_13990 [Leptospira bandrabouensis]|uniref:hypothetical protein n=1 Tax=Leptospira bandrabouensis TaxID=2484903 RepID=UPI00223E1B50|nr:hypothetical protein [Leptospira bandrabouensis]MCW7459581.1 hypothetical protein [Leptospira bandrabouensis]MCW7478401.1 hypothetical protein [Leptospira bandrabouensis]MCW7486316.1 hypothetical protein [Leptospira bandrabouensis]
MILLPYAAGGLGSEMSATTPLLDGKILAGGTTVPETCFDFLAADFFLGTFLSAFFADFFFATMFYL